MQTVSCPGCRAVSAIDERASAHRCPYCGLEFVYNATVAARVEVEEACRRRLDQVADELEALAAQGRAAAQAGDREVVRRAAARRVAIQSAIYRQTNYYALMGIVDEGGIERYERGWMAQELAAFLPAAEAAVDDRQNAAALATTDRYVAALNGQDFEALVPAFRELSRNQLDSDPRWADRGPQERAAAVEQAVRNMVESLPWTTPHQRASVGLRAPHNQGAGGSMRCGNCGAEVSMAGLDEAVTCPYCGGVARRQLHGVDRHRARGLSAAEAQEQHQLEQAAAGGIDELLELAGTMLGNDVEYSEPRRRALLFCYARLVSPERAAPLEAHLLERLDLLPPRPCSSCGEVVAPARAEPIACPLCEGRAAG
jgi:DNA-directed RNA polymerase subunit RPC12/RpoP